MKTCKNSGIKWIGNVPKHWEISKLKKHFIPRNQKVSDKDYAPLSVTKDGVLPQLDTACKTENGENRKLVCKGDYVVNSRSDRKGSGGVSPYDGSVSLINIVMEPTDGERAYYHYLFRCNNFVEEFYRNGRGIVSDLWTTRYQEMRNIDIPIPPLAEQRAIVSYLDGKVGQIDTYVAKQTQQIELLKELKQAVIANAVTKGIDNKAKLKQTGISWIGHVPQHWERCRCKDVLTEIKLLVGNGEYALLSLTTNGVIVRDLSEGKGKFPKDFNTYKVVKPNDLVFCLFDVDETPRTVGLVHNHGMLTGAYNVFETKNVDTSFLYHYFIALDNRKALKPLYKGLRKVIPLPAFMSMPLYLPPLS